MNGNSSEQRADSSNALLEKRDSPKITDLIEQLDRDLKQTLNRAQKKSPR